MAPGRPWRVTALCGAQLTWEAAYATGYRIQVSDNGADWRDVYSTTDGVGGTENLSFDEGLMEQYGAAIGEEFAGKGAQVALGPTVNIVRDPRWGRSFES